MAVATEKILSKEQTNLVNIFKHNFGSSDTSPNGQKNAIFMNFEFSTPGCKNIEEYQMGSTIGRGAYAEVKESLLKATGEKVAIK